MLYGYVRVSTIEQDTARQRADILEAANATGPHYPTLFLPPPWTLFSSLARTPHPALLPYSRLISRHKRPGHLTPKSG
jgi:hypothetical protein